MNIHDMHALVTGGASGLGLATARHLAERGARVTILDLDPLRGGAAASTAGLHFVQADVGDEASVERALAACISGSGAPRIVVNCAGVGTAARIVGREGKLSTDAFARTLRVNLLGTYHVMSHAARAMMALDPVNADGERGVIVNTASVAFEDGQLGQSAYAASKGGIAAMTLPAAREFARAGIRVVTIAPGLFHTPMMEGLPPEVTARIASDIPFPARLGQAREYAALAAHIVENAFLNGTVIRLDGAVRLPPK